ncbi:transcriptional regulator with PAS, ATPase and Fis domain [Keratinibaculum paraultunense]|uniref:Transcriptional regulator with PAS, ATPase and Fis domain n=1 Tax=Keratinibaculum paraultunense TaxID=1278232 RepID=A0A4R3KQC9_9FIRM|nr:sigma 54-interacting transcriptional regulator [Keratinibaculum paraultunense]QQY79636.1 sigma 54-interacting transcriptional regulator [Keratinibaculum paraultunense]TCS87059.1 transcriptional regulator with PAS, ATPase and Fis domain [Keratinibaculum paraultunense]
MNLFNIQKSTQEVAEAISAVLNVDVTIVDIHLNRVAATGEYKNLIGRSLPKNCAFESIANKRKPEFIDNPNISQKCKGCSLRGSCAEMATVGYPILNGEDLLGVIGLIAFNMEQKKKLQREYNSLIVFLSKLGDLLAGNLKYANTIINLKIQTEETKKIIDGLGNGIICTDNLGNIKFVNSKAEDYLKIDSNNIINKSIFEIIPSLQLNFKEYIPIETKLTIDNKRESFVIKIIPVMIQDKKVSNIIEIHETFNMVKSAFTLLEGQNNISFDDIIGDSPKMLKSKEMSERVATSKSSILLRGESGTGKELFARAIHNSSNRKNAPFVAINCASIPDNLLEAELFGYEGGAFTGAKKTGQMGKFELANEGTLFLDEIGDLPIHLQPKLLRVLQEEAFMRVGGRELIPVNFRLIAATNRNLEDMISKGEFREDLYYRLNVIPIHIPPLRERIGDIEKLSNYFINKYCKKLNKDLKYFSKEVKEAFSRYNWPGNVRELENVIEYLVNVVNSREIKLENLPYNIKQYFKGNNAKKDSLKEIMDDYEKNILKSYLEAYGNTTKDKEKIASILEIDLSTLYRKLNKHNLQ